MSRRDAAGAAMLLLLLGGLAGVAWLSRNPSSAVVSAARDWPLVGPLAARFQDAYRAPGTARPRSAAGEETAQELRTLAPLAPPPPTFAEDHPRVWLLAGMELKSAPAAGADTVLEIPAIERVPKLEREGDWFQVSRRGLVGWVYLPGYREDAEVPFGHGIEPPRPLPPRPPDPADLAAARELLAAGGRELRLGPYALVTDVDDEQLLAALAAPVAGLDAVYRGRYGLAPLGEPLAAIVLYRDEKAYRALQSRFSRLASLRAAGHAARGIAALYVGERTSREVAATLIHELAHLVNRRALGPALPAWIDEGLADDLAYGTLAPGSGTLAGERSAAGDAVTFTGGLASLLLLEDHRRAGTLPSLPWVLGLDWDSFVGEGSRLNYALCGLFVRFLVEGEGGRRAPALRRFLATVAAGRPPASESLRAEIGQGWPVIEAQFRVWVAGQAVAQGVAAPQQGPAD